MLEIPIQLKEKKEEKKKVSPLEKKSKRVIHKEKKIYYS